jgi:hypothetical protein
MIIFRADCQSCMKIQQAFAANQELRDPAPGCHGECFETCNLQPSAFNFPR